MWKLCTAVPYIDLTPLSLISMCVQQGHTDSPFKLAKAAQQESILPIRKLIFKLTHASLALVQRYQLLVPLLAPIPRQQHNQPIFQQCNQLDNHQHTQPKFAISAAISALVIVTMRVLCAQTTIVRTTVEGNES